MPDEGRPSGGCPQETVVIFQEVYREDPWKLLVTCILTNQTRGKVSLAVSKGLFSRWKTPTEFATASYTQVREIVGRLGFGHRRTNLLMKFNAVWLLRGPCHPRGIPGCGKYAQDSYEIFVESRADVAPTDKVLRWYLEREKTR